MDNEQTGPDRNRPSLEQLLTEQGRKLAPETHAPPAAAGIPMGGMGNGPGQVPPGQVGHTACAEATDASLVAAVAEAFRFGDDLLCAHTQASLAALKGETFAAERIRPLKLSPERAKSLAGSWLTVAKKYGVDAKWGPEAAAIAATLIWVAPHLAIARAAAQEARRPRPQPAKPITPAEDPDPDRA